MTDLAQRAAAIGKAATQRIETSYIAREWWSITRPNEAPIPVYFWPPQTCAEIMQNWPAYRHCGVLPG
jgi:hypothetical protein